MNTVWEVEEPINIWHDSWICLHNWCRNLNWIIIASWRTCGPSHYVPPCTTPRDAALKSSPYRLHDNVFLCVHEHTRAWAYARTRSDGRRQTINVLPGCDWRSALVNPLGGVGLCFGLTGVFLHCLCLLHTHTMHVHRHMLNVNEIRVIMYWSNEFSVVALVNAQFLGTLMLSIWDF